MGGYKLPSSLAGSNNILSRINILESIIKRLPLSQNSVISHLRTVGVDMSSQMNKKDDKINNYVRIMKISKDR